MVRTPKNVWQLHRWLTSAKRRRRQLSRGSCSTLQMEDSQVGRHSSTFFFSLLLSFDLFFFPPFFQSFTLCGRTKREQPLSRRKLLRFGIVAMTTGCWLASYSILKLGEAFECLACVYHRIAKTATLEHQKSDALQKCSMTRFITH